MFQSNWQDRFLFGLIFLSVFFVLFAGWAIFRDKETSRDEPITQHAELANKPINKPTKSANISIPSHFSPEFIQQMTQRMHAGTQSDNLHEPRSHLFSAEFETGFQWASTNRIKYFSECASSASIDYIDGCRTFIEINNYINQIQEIQSFKSH
jgi:hypothetical protein